MKKHIILCLIIFLLCACSFQRDYYKELSNYYLSLTSSTQINENHVSVENQVYDFQRRKMTIHDNYQLTAQYSLAVYDYKEKAILYSAKDSNNNDQVYLYDNKTKKTTQLTENFWGVNYIIPRTNDYIVVGVKLNTHILSLWSIDKKTHNIKQIKISDSTHDDMSIWQVAYIPQTNDLIIQAASNSEEYKILNEWNMQDEHGSQDINVPYYHYLYHDEKIKYLFTENMPQSQGLICNGKKVLVSVDSKDNGNSLIQYDLNTKKKETLENVTGLSRVFYLDDDGQYLYAFLDGIVRKDIHTGKEEWLDYEFKDIGYYNNFILLRR